jgi:hypothetical protein
MLSRIFTVFLGVLLFLTVFSAFGQALDWPRDMTIESGTVTMYEPQIDSMEGDVVKFRAALGYKNSAGSEPVFGAAWFDTRVVIDRETRLVHVENITLTDTRFPEGSEHVHGEMADYITASLPDWDIDFSLDSLLTSLEAAEEEIAAAQNLNMDPPVIFYRDHPALLVYIDGDPVMREIENSNYQAVINTPYPLIYDGQRTYYLNAAQDVWYQARSVTGPYSYDPRPPSDITGMVDQEEAGEYDGEPVNASNAPEIVVSTEPSELLVSDGEADFTPLVDDLLVLKNSDSDVFMHVSTQQFYIVLSGRWYRADTLEGPWTFNPADELPPAFANIPQDAKQADSRVFVAGTDEAREAVMDAQIPQTAAVKKGSVDLEVTYDGDPRFDGIEGTNLAYAENTASTVLKSGSNYYVVEDAVWYIGPSPTGPWRVAESRPEDVDAIPSESPVYNVKYVYIYDTTPEVVYVGYTPGYTGSYVYHTTIVYGTGWYYRPWVSPYYYYPRYGTWGFHITYNPWTGWGFGLSWGWGPFRVGFYSGGYWHRHHAWHHRHYGRWGPGGYRPRPVHYGHNININNPNININNPNISTRDNNLYRDKAQRANVAQTRDFRPGSQEARDRSSLADRSGSRDQVAGMDRPGSASNRPASGSVSPGDLRNQASGLGSTRPSTAQNNVFTDKSGNVYRQTDGGWQKRDSGGWQNVPSTGGSASNRPATGGSASTRPATGSGASTLTSSGSNLTNRPSTGAGGSTLERSSYDRQGSYNTRQSSAYNRSSSGYSNTSSLDRQSYSRQRSSTRSSQYSAQRSYRSGGGARRR